MRLKNITAVPHPAGNRIDLAWVNPDPQGHPGICVVRREGAYPVSANPAAVSEGVVVPLEANLLSSVTDTGEIRYSLKDENLRGETVYYYTLFPYQNDPNESVFDRHHCAAAMATAPHDLAGQMYELLPAIYHRYDTALPESEPSAGDSDDKLRQQGQLRRFLALPGGQLDQLYSHARALLDAYDLNKTDGRLLPLLAQWIGWQTDHRLGYDGQRNEIRSAPHVYKAIGLIPTVEATVKRIFGWECRTKEFVHNVFLSNRPERLNLWLTERISGSQWSKPAEPLSLDFAYEGRTAAAYEAQGERVWPATYDYGGRIWLFYHTLRNGRWEIWLKTRVTFKLQSKFESNLNDTRISSGLRDAFAHAQCPISQDTAITVKAIGKEWLIADIENGQEYSIKKKNSHLTVYGWTPSRPFSDGKHCNRHPTAAFQSWLLWVFWDSYDETEETWRIQYRLRDGDHWDPAERFWLDNDPKEGIERRRPCAVTDNQNALWLFWLEKTDGNWRLRYSVHYKDWLATAGGLTRNIAPGIEDDFFVLSHPGDVSRPLALFWARRKAVGGEQTRWEIAYRFKKSLHPDEDDWSEIAVLPKGGVTDDDREPAAVIVNGKVDLYWSSTRDGSWSIWRATLEGEQWGTPEQLTGTPYSQRNPLPHADEDGLLLFHRSSQSLNYVSQVYRATDTVDSRYAGCTTVDTRNLDKNGQRGLYEDFQTYTYDTGLNGRRTDSNWYARDTVGIYLTPNPQDPDVRRNRDLIERILREFLPIQVRLVFIIQLADMEFVYTYDSSDVPEEVKRFIWEMSFYSLTVQTSDAYSGLEDSYLDRAPDWFWFRSWSEPEPGHRTVEVKLNPVSISNTQFRTWHTGIQAGG